MMKQYIRRNRTHSVAFRTSEDVWDYLKGIADQEGCTVSSVVNAIIASEMNRKDDSHE